MVPQITILHLAGVRTRSEIRALQALVLYRVRSLFLPTVIRTADIPGLYLALSIAAGIVVAASHRLVSRRVASHSIRLSLRLVCDTRCVFHRRSTTLTIAVLSRHVCPTRCNKFAIVPHNCRKPRAENPSTGPRRRRPRASSDWNFTRIARNLPSSSLRVTTSGDMPCSVRVAIEYDEYIRYQYKNRGIQV